MHLSLSVITLALAASSSVALSFDNAPHPSLDKPSNAIKARQIGRDSRDRAGPVRLDNGRMDHSGNLAAGDQLRQLLESLGNNGRLAINGDGNGNGNGRNNAVDHDGTSAKIIIIAQGNGEHDQQRGDGRGRGGNRGNNDDDRDRGRGRGGREDGPGRNRGGNDDRRGGGRNKGKDNLGVGAGGDASALPPPPALGTDASAIVDASAIDPPARPTAVPFRPSAAPAPPAPPAALNGTDASAIVDASATAVGPAGEKPVPPTALPAPAAAAAGPGEKKGKVQAKVRHGVESRRRGKRNTPPHA